MMTSLIRLTATSISLLVLTLVSVSTVHAADPPPSAGIPVPKMDPAALALLQDCSFITGSVSGVDLCFDPSVASPRWIKLEVVGEENATDVTGHFPSGWGIRAELAILNRGTEEAVITAGTKVLTFTTAKEEVSVIADSDLIVPARTGDTAGYATVVAYFDSEVLEDGLSEISYVVNPDGEIPESNQDNNEGTLKLFHPSAYPNIIITDVIVPDYVQKWGLNFWDAYEITVKGKNVGGDMTRSVMVQLAVNYDYGFQHFVYIEPLKHGGSFEHKYEIKQATGAMVDGQIPVEVRISDNFNGLIGPYSWASLINTDEPPGVSKPHWQLIDFALNLVNNESYLDSPTEIGSEAVIIGTYSNYPDPFGVGTLVDSYGQSQGWGVSTPKDYDGDAVYHESFKLARPVPHLIYPHADQDFNLTYHPPVVIEDPPAVIQDWINCHSHAGESQEFVGLDNKLDQRWVHPCFGIVEDSSSPDVEWVRNWPDSLLRFRWLPTRGSMGGQEPTSYKVKLQISDANQNLMHEIVRTPEWAGIMDGTFTGIGVDEFKKYIGATNNLKERSYDAIYDYKLNVFGADEEKAKAEAKEGFFNQYVYDGPPLEPGDYNWRVTNDVNAEEGSEIWSEEFKFTIQAHDLNSGGSSRLKDTDLSSGIVFRGEVTNVFTGGFTVATEAGFVNMRTDTDTTIYSGLTGMHSEVPLGWKVHVMSEEAPYIIGGALVPYGRIPVAESVLQLITNRTHKRCTVVGEGNSGKTAVACDDGDYMELNEADLPAGASTVVLVKDHKECEVLEINSSGVASLKCEDGEVIKLDQPLKKGQVILVPGKSAKLISTASHLYERIQEFKIHANSVNEEQQAAELDGYGSQIEAGFDDAFALAMAKASPEVQEFLETVTALDDMVAGLAGSFISGDNDFIFDVRDVSALAVQLQKFADTYENMVDLMVTEMLGDMPQETRDETIADIKSQSTQFIAEMKTELEKAVYFLGQGNLIEAISVMDGAMRKEEQWQQQVLMPGSNSSMASEAITLVEQELTQYGDSLSKEKREDIEQKLEALKTAVANEESDVQTLIDELYQAMETAWDSYDTDSDTGGSGGQSQTDLEATGHQLIEMAENELKEYSAYFDDAKKQEIEKAISTLKEAVDSGSDSEIQIAIDSLAKAMESSGSGG